MDNGLEYKNTLCEVENLTMAQVFNKADKKHGMIVRNCHAVLFVD